MLQNNPEKVIDRLSDDLKTAFPEMSGFSPRNLKYMRSLAQLWPDRTIVQRTVAQIPWRSNLIRLDKHAEPAALQGRAGFVARASVGYTR
jgi:hypothetical protein